MHSFHIGRKTQGRIGTADLVDLNDYFDFKINEISEIKIIN